MKIKSWVIVKFSNGKIKVWRDYGDIAWGSATYEVLGYFDGSYEDARKHGLKYESGGYTDD